MTKKTARFYKKFIGKDVYIKGSHIPFTFFLDYVIEGYNITEFLSSYPWVKKKDLLKELEEVKTKTASGYAL